MASAETAQSSAQTEMISSFLIPWRGTRGYSASMALFVALEEGSGGFHHLSSQTPIDLAGHKIYRPSRVRRSTVLDRKLLWL